MTLYDQYIQDVTKGKLLVCEYVRLAVHRHKKDVVLSKKKDYPYYFDQDSADRAISFISLLRHTAGSFQNQPFNLQPYQAFGIACIFGWKRKDTGFRRFTKVYWDTGRKSGKSELLGACSLYTLGWDNEGAPQNYCVATTREQAAYVYNAAHYMAKKLIADSDSAAERLKLVQYNIKDIENNGYIKCLTADSETNDGANPHFASIDEYHAHGDDSMLKVVETGMGGRDQPILWITTTAGFNKNGPCYSFRDMVIKILRGQIENENLFGYIFSLDENDDPHDEKNWIKSNPNIGNTPKWDWMRTKHKEAMAEGGETLVQFLTKNLNIWTDAAKIWIEDGLYTACGGGKRNDLFGKSCYVGVDLASEHDLTAVNYLFPAQEGLEKPYYFTDYYCPDHKFTSIRVDGVIYSDFERGGWVKRTSGNVIDKEAIKRDILANAEMFEIKSLGYDPFKAVELISELSALGIKCYKVPQSAQLLGSGYSHWKELILGGRVEHDGSPVTRWQMGNIEMYTDGNGNQKAIKSNGKKENKIDGPVAICNSWIVFLGRENMEEVEVSRVEDLGYI